MGNTAVFITAEQKRCALEQVLQSEAFSRSEQLRKFMKYVCEEEFEGRAEELTEYRIGVEGLGRPRSFNPTDDSTVRNRAYALRHKLEEYYTRENPQCGMRIVLAKGSYVPRFVETPASTEVVPAPAPMLPPIQPTVIYQPMARSRHLVAAFAAGVAVAVAAAAVAIGLMGWPGAPAVDPVLAEFWGPLLARDADVLVCVATPPQAVLRRYPAGAPPRRPRLLEAPTEMAARLRQRPLAPGSAWYTLITGNSPFWGDSMGALTVARLLSQAGASFRVAPERVVNASAFRERNMVLFGVPEYSGAAERLLAGEAFTLCYSPQVEEQVIWRRTGKDAGAPAYVPVREKGSLAVVYALITVLPSPGTEGTRKRTVVFTGVNSAGAQAAAEFFSSPTALAAFRERLAKQGYRTVPAAYQIVVRSTSSDTLPLNITYQDHVVRMK
jgi:hypothetical protein